MDLFEKHLVLFTEAQQAITNRTFYTPYPEHHKVYGEEALALGKSSFATLLNNRFTGLSDETNVEWVGQEESPYSRNPLDVKYPAASVETLIDNASKSMRSWKNAGPKQRAGILGESLERIKSKFFEMAFATMHTTGQSFMMAFQASGPHASDRALEALALSLQEQLRYPEAVDWEKPMGKFSIKLHKNFKVIPRGISVAIGCSTFPVWNSVPGIFASLAAGNPVIAKPHPGAVLPLAIVMKEIRAVLTEEGFDANILQIAPDTFEKPIAKELCENPAVKVIDFTGGPEFGNYVESLPGKITFTEKAGINPVILDSVENLDPVLENLAFSVCLYSGQMCTCPQNFYIPENGVKEGGTIVSFDEVVSRFSAAVQNLANHPKIGAGTLAAIQSDKTLNKLSHSEAEQQTVLESNSVSNPEFDGARAVTPRILQTTSDAEGSFNAEYFGPTSIIVKTKNTEESVALAKSLAEKHGAITCAAYTTDSATENMIREEMEEAFVPVSINLTGFIWVNQAAGFSDFHVTGGNPAGNASFSNPEFVNKRFVWVGHRKLIN